MNPLGGSGSGGAGALPPSGITLVDDAMQVAISPGPPVVVSNTSLEIVVEMPIEVQAEEGIEVEIS
jgi:hypothetical protein